MEGAQQPRRREGALEIAGGERPERRRAQPPMRAPTTRARRPYSSHPLMSHTFVSSLSFRCLPSLPLSLDRVSPCGSLCSRSVLRRQLTPAVATQARQRSFVSRWLSPVLLSSASACESVVNSMGEVFEPEGSTRRVHAPACTRHARLHPTPAPRLGIPTAAPRGRAGQVACGPPHTARDPGAATSNHRCAHLPRAHGVPTHLISHISPAFPFHSLMFPVSPSSPSLSRSSGASVALLLLAPFSAANLLRP